MPRLVRARQQLGQPALELAPVRHAGQRVVRGLVAQLARQVQRHRDVVEHQHRADQEAVAAADRRGGVQHRDALAVAALQQRVLAPRRRRLALQHLAHRIRQRLAAGLVQQAVDGGDRLPARLVRRPAGQARGHRVQVLDQPGLVGGDDAVADRGQRHLRQVALALQLQLDVLAVGDVAQHRRVERALALVEVVDRQLVERARAATRHAQLQVGDGAARQRPHDQLAHARVQRRVVEDEAGGVVLVQRGAGAVLGPELDVLVGAEGGRVAVDRDQVRVPGQEPAAIRHGAHRLARAQGGVDRVRVGQEVRRQPAQVEAGGDGLGALARHRRRDRLRRYGLPCGRGVRERWGSHERSVRPTAPASVPGRRAAHPARRPAPRSSGRGPRAAAPLPPARRRRARRRSAAAQPWAASSGRACQG